MTTHAEAKPVAPLVTFVTTTDSIERALAFLLLYADKVEASKPLDIPATTAASLRNAASILSRPTVTEAQAREWFEDRYRRVVDSQADFGRFGDGYKEMPIHRIWCFIAEALRWREGVQK